MIRNTEPRQATILVDIIIGNDNVHKESAIFFLVRERVLIGALSNMVATCIFIRFVI